MNFQKVIIQSEAIHFATGFLTHSEILETQLTHFYLAGRSAAAIAKHGINNYKTDAKTYSIKA
jgi:hypothetical protein